MSERESLAAGAVGQLAEIARVDSAAESSPAELGRVAAELRRRKLWELAAELRRPEPGAVLPEIAGVASAALIELALHSRGAAGRPWGALGPESGELVR